MRKTIEASFPCSPENLFEIISDVSVYSAWLDLVGEAKPTSAVEGDAGPAWSVTLEAKVGPFARSKRLRMVEDLSDVPIRFRLARSEVDGRDHAAWILDSTIRGTEAGSDLTMDLSYEGDLWSGLLETVLSSQIERSRQKLMKYVAERFDQT